MAIVRYNTVATLEEAARDIDKVFGSRTADRKPELVIALVQALVLDEMTDNIDELGPKLRSDHPLMGETFHGIERALTEISYALGGGPDRQFQKDLDQALRESERNRD
jgi:hypothetical protein